eukprot:4812410-Pyramimonas_sp.AAC.1
MRSSQSHGYFWGKHSNVESALAFDMNPLVCALSLGAEWGALAWRSSGPPHREAAGGSMR